MISLGYTMSSFEFKEHLYLYTIGFTLKLTFFYLIFEITTYSSLLV
jgi:hypothetical protein